MKTDSKSYPGKILLFGEYAVLAGGSGLAIPWHVRKARWVDGDNPKRKKQLLDFVYWLLDNAPEWFRAKEMLEAVGEGLYLDSEIPEGYGAGSSGAVCAAVADRFGTKAWEESGANLQEMFARIESYFHGSSSGLDPLVIYTEQALRIKEGTLSEVKLPGGGTEMEMLLVDTGKPRKTAPLVAHFRKLLTDSDFKSKLRLSYITANEDCIGAFLGANPVTLWKPLTRLSVFQYEHMSRMIPDDFLPIWRQGLESDTFRLKLCGAGGGGYLLAAVKKEGVKSFKELLSTKYIELIYSL